MSHTAAIITVSDRIFQGEQENTVSPAIGTILESAGFEVAYSSAVPNDMERLRAELKKCADELNIPLILTAGGTGLSPGNITPEATMAVVEREVRGISEAMRMAGMQATQRACLSRGVAGIRGGSLIVNLPGSEKAARENLTAVVEALAHAVDMLSK